MVDLSHQLSCCHHGREQDYQQQESRMGCQAWVRSVSVRWKLAFVQSVPVNQTLTVMPRLCSPGTEFSKSSKLPKDIAKFLSTTLIQKVDWSLVGGWYVTNGIHIGKMRRIPDVEENGWPTTLPHQISTIVNGIELFLGKFAATSRLFDGATMPWSVGCGIWVEKTIQGSAVGA